MLKCSMIFGKYKKGAMSFILQIDIRKVLSKKGFKVMKRGIPKRCFELQM